MMMMNSEINVRGWRQTEVIIIATYKNPVIVL